MLAEQHTALAHQFDDLTQQHEASSLGMWAFLLTEIMFFGGLFAGYTVYRTAYAAGFVAGSQHLGDCPTDGPARAHNDDPHDPPHEKGTTGTHDTEGCSRRDSCLGRRTSVARRRR